jgi:hypothetical protein
MAFTASKRPHPDRRRGACRPARLLDPGVPSAPRGQSVGPPQALAASRHDREAAVECSERPSPEAVAAVDESGAASDHLAMRFEYVDRDRLHDPARPLIDERRKSSHRTKQSAWRDIAAPLLPGSSITSCVIPRNRPHAAQVPPAPGPPRRIGTLRIGRRPLRIFWRTSARSTSSLRLWKACTIARLRVRCALILPIRTTLLARNSSLRTYRAWPRVSSPVARAPSRPNRSVAGRPWPSTWRRTVAWASPTRYNGALRRLPSHASPSVHLGR